MPLITTLAALIALAGQDKSLPTMPQPDEEVAVMDTAKGKIVLMFYPDVAPKTVKNFKSLINDHFFDGTRFHRCIPGFVIQGGDPFSRYLDSYDVWGNGYKQNKDGSQRSIPGEFGKRLLHTRGVLSMARDNDPNSASSQFFICVADTPRLDGKYAAFGRVVKGIEVVDQIVATGSTDPAKHLQNSVKAADAVVVNHVSLTTWEKAEG